MRRWIYSAIQYQHNIQLLSSQITAHSTLDKTYNLFAEKRYFSVGLKGEVGKIKPIWFCATNIMPAYAISCQMICGPSWHRHLSESELTSTTIWPESYLHQLLTETVGVKNMKNNIKRFLKKKWRSCLKIASKKFYFLHSQHGQSSAAQRNSYNARATTLLNGQEMLGSKYRWPYNGYVT